MANPRCWHKAFVARASNRETAPHAKILAPVAGPCQKAGMDHLLHLPKRAVALGLAWFALAAASPAPSTAERIADLLDAGKPIEAFSLAQAKAGEGDPEGQFALGWFYDSGEHLTADKAKAVASYRQCADAGLSQCQWRLGVMLDTGEGLAEDPVAAFDLLSKAAAQGNVQAKVDLAVMHATGRGTPLDYAKANSLYEAAAAAGEARGFFGVGLLYLDGQGVPRDGETAAAWFSVATALGDPSAKAMTDRLLAGQKTDVLDRIAEKANAIYAQYVAPLTAAAPAAPPARPARTP